MTASTRSACIQFALKTSLGWVAVSANDDVVRRLTLGHATKAEAHRAIGVGEPLGPPPESIDGLAQRIRRYADGHIEDFADVLIDTGYLTPLGRAVFARCRRIPFGQTLTYGRLADEVGHPGAARAVGQFMASNRTPLLMPCHRVVAAGGQLGGFTAPGGVLLKKKLLELEAIAVQ